MGQFHEYFHYPSLRWTPVKVRHRFLISSIFKRTITSKSGQTSRANEMPTRDARLNVQKALANNQPILIPVENTMEALDISLVLVAVKIYE